MISKILLALPWSSIFSLAVKVVLYFLEKTEHTKDMKKDFLKFVEAFHEHRQIPVQLNSKWEKIVKAHREELEREIVNENLEKLYSDKPYSEL